MSRKYAAGSKAWGICGRSGQRCLLKDMVFDGRFPGMRVHRDWYEPKDPLEHAPKLEDPIALWRPSPESFIITAPVLAASQASPGAPIILTWTAATSSVVKITGYKVYKSVNGADAVLVTTLLNTYDSYATLLTETLTYQDDTVYADGDEVSYYVQAYS